MNIKKTTIFSLMSLAAIAPIRAQMAKICYETGVTAEINKEVVYSSGLHGILGKNKNITDLYCGMLVDGEKQVTFESQLENEYNWTKNISSWIRETFHLSKQENNLTSELSPIKINKSINKFDTFIAPVYIIENNFKENETRQGAGVVLNATYNADSNNAIKLEAEYASEPVKNIFKTKFGKLKDNITYVISYIRNF